MKVYIGRRRADGTAFVHVTGDPDGVERDLDPRLDLVNHSPTGLEWGYGGSGPAQLALALLADVLHQDATAVTLHQPFKWRFVSSLSQRANWRMTEDEVLKKAAAISEYPLTRMHDGSIRRCCIGCTEHLLQRGMLRKDRNGIFNYAEGVTLEMAREAVKDRHPPEPWDEADEFPAAHAYLPHLPLE